MRMRPTRHVESAHQCVVVEWAHWSLARYPELALLYAIPNGGRRDPREAARLRQEGVRAGMPDLCLPVARCGYHALFIEMKRPKVDGKRAGVVSEAQQDMQARLRHHGNLVLLCYSADQAIAALRAYLDEDMPTLAVLQAQEEGDE